MKIVLIPLMLVLTGCATNQNLYYDATKSISKDATITQSACFAAVGEIAKGGDTATKAAALILAERCKTEPVRIEQPKRNWFGF